MKTTNPSILIIILSCLLVLSCDNETTDCPKLDKSLTGSISHAYKIEMEGSIDNVIIEGFKPEQSLLDIIKRSDSKVSFELYSTWVDKEIKISIPEILVTGKPYDVAFDFSTKNATISFDDYENVSTEVFITGWMKRNYNTRCSPAIPHYLCDMNIEFNMQGKKFFLTITSAQGLS